MMNGDNHIVIRLPMSLKDRLYSLIVCRKRVLDADKILEIHDIVEQYSLVVDRSVYMYIDSARRISSIIGLPDDTLYSLLVYAGLTIQLPYSMYYLLTNSGFRLGSWDPLRCPVIVDKKVAKHMIVVEDTPDGVFIGRINQYGGSRVPPSDFHALLDSLHGFTYTVIDSLIASRVDDLYIGVVEKYGVEYYLPLSHMLVTRVSEILGFGEPSPTVIGFRTSDLLRIAKTTINLFRGLALRRRS